MSIEFTVSVGQMFRTMHFHGLINVHTHCGELHAHDCLILTKLEDSWVFFSILLIGIINLLGVTQPVHLGCPVSGDPILGFASSSDISAFFLGISAWTVIINLDGCEILLQSCWIQVEVLASVIIYPQVSLLVMLFFASNTDSIRFFSLGNRRMMFNIVENILKILLWDKIIKTMNMLFRISKIIMAMKILVSLFSFGVMLRLMFNLLMLRMRLVLGSRRLPSSDSMSLGSMVNRMTSLGMEVSTIRSMISQSTMLRQGMRHGLIHLTAIIGRLLIQIAISILTESWVTALILSLYVRLIIILWINNLKLLINLIV